jgi:uncharacterized membrane protein YbhN (UPF0104 family)
MPNIEAIKSFLSVELTKLQNFWINLQPLFMKEKLKKSLKYLLSASLAIILLWFSFRGVEWDKFWVALVEVNWGFVLLSMAAGAAAFWIRALRWRRLLLPLDGSISRTTAFNGVNIANISNFVFPRIGEFVRCGVIVRRSESVDASDSLKKKASYEKVLGTVVLERAWELLVMLLLLAVVIIFAFGRYGGFFVTEVWQPMSQKFGANTWLLFVGVLSFFALCGYLLWRFRDSNSLCRKIWSIFRGVGQGFATCMKMDQKWLFFAYTLVIWLLYWFMSACIMWSVSDVQLSLGGMTIIDALFLSIIGGLGFAMPVPGGIGAYHYIIALAITALFKAPWEAGIFFATLSHTSQAITQIIFGAGSYAYETLKK